MGSLGEALEKLKKERAKKISRDNQEKMKAFAQELDKVGFEKTAIAEGRVIPDFRLKNAVGKEVEIEVGKIGRPLVIVFYRGGWCPYCNLTLRNLNKRIDEINKWGDLVAISPQTPDASLSTREKLDLGFEVLSDVGNKVARLFGIVFALNQDVVQVYRQAGYDLAGENGDSSYELPIPATFVIDANGLVVKRHLEVDYTRRMEVEDIIESLRIAESLTD